MIYFDAAYIAKCYLNEPGADRVIALAAQSGGLCSCEYGRLEFFSTLHRHLREGHLGRRDVNRILANLERDEQEGVWHWLPVTPELIRDVSRRILNLPKTILVRSGDALHLGCACENGFKEIYSNDQRILACSSYFDLRGIDILAAS